MAESIGGTDTLTDTAVDLVVSTLYDLRIKIDTNRYAYCYVNGALVRTTGQLTTAVDLIPLFQWGPVAKTAARGLSAHWIEMSKLRS